MASVVDEMLKKQMLINPEAEEIISLAFEKSKFMISNYLKAAKSTWNSENDWRQIPAIKDL